MGTPGFGALRQQGVAAAGRGPAGALGDGRAPAAVVRSPATVDGAVRGAAAAGSRGRATGPGPLRAPRHSRRRTGGRPGAGARRGGMESAERRRQRCPAGRQASGDSGDGAEFGESGERERQGPNSVLRGRFGRSPGARNPCPTPAGGTLSTNKRLVVQETDGFRAEETLRTVTCYGRKRKVGH